jgi:hypothetical protein
MPAAMIELVKLLLQRTAFSFSRPVQISYFVSGYRFSDTAIALKNNPL